MWGRWSAVWWSHLSRLFSASLLLDVAPATVVFLVWGVSVYTSGNTYLLQSS